MDIKSAIYSVNIKLFKESYKLNMTDGDPEYDKKFTMKLWL